MDVRSFFFFTQHSIPTSFLVSGQAQLVFNSKSTGPTVWSFTTTRYLDVTSIVDCAATFSRDAVIQRSLQTRLLHGSLTQFNSINVAAHYHLAHDRNGAVKGLAPLST